MESIIFTLCLLHDKDRLLLGYKKRGLGEARWNGFGGKLLPGESIKEAAYREVKEECGLRTIQIEERGVLEFKDHNSDWCAQTHVFAVTEWEGEPIESEEMRPQWFSLDAIPYKEMWPDDSYWLPLFLEGKHFKGRFVINEGKEVISHFLKEIF